MANAICTKCGKEQHWFARRGNKLSDIKSDCCGAELKGKTKNMENKNKGRKYVKCAVCGRRRLPENLVKPTIDFQVFGYKYEGKIFKAGVFSCKWHSFVPIGKVYGEIIDMPEEEKKAFFDATRNANVKEKN